MRYRGKVFVYTGILPYCKDEGGIAAVLGHEISHVLLNHPAERLSSQLLSIVPMYIAWWFFGVSPSASQLGFDVLFNLPNSRKHEVSNTISGLHTLWQ